MKKLLLVTAIGCLFAFNLYGQCPADGFLEVGPATADSLTFYYTAPPNVQVTSVTLWFRDFSGLTPGAQDGCEYFFTVSVLACQTTLLTVPVGSGNVLDYCPIHC